MQTKQRQRYRSKLTAALLASTVIFVAAPSVHAVCAASARIGSGSHLSEVQTLFAAQAEPRTQRALGKLGPSAAPAMWAVLSGRARKQESEFDTSACKDLAQKVIASWPSEEVIPELLSAANSRTPAGERLVLIEMLSWTDSAAALPAIVEVLSKFRPEEHHSQRVKAELQHALQALLDDNPHRFRKLEPLLEGLPEQLLSSALECTATNPTQEAGKLLASAAKQSPRTERLVLECLARCKSAETRWNSLDFMPIARRALMHKDPLVRRMGITVLGEFGDTSSFFELTEVLERSEGSLQRTARAALQKMSGMKRDWDADRWRGWLAGEQERFAADSEQALGLASADAGTALVAIRRLTTHKLFAESAAELVGRALNNHDPVVRRLACEGFSALTSQTAVSALAIQLDDSDETVHEAAHAALRTLTGRDLGPTRAAWEDWWSGLH